MGDDNDQKHLTNYVKMMGHGLEGIELILSGMAPGERYDRLSKLCADIRVGVSKFALHADPSYRPNLDIYEKTTMIPAYEEAEEGPEQTGYKIPTDRSATSETKAMRQPPRPRPTGKPPVPYTRGKKPSK